MKAGNCAYGCCKDVPEIVPVFPLPSALLLPRADMPLNIFEPRYVAMVDAAIARDRLIGMIQPDDAAPATVHGPALRSVGCLGRIISFAETGDGRYLITLTGVARFRVLEEVMTNCPFRECRISCEPFGVDFADEQEEIDRTSVLRAFRAYLDAHRLTACWETVNSAPDETLINALAMMAPFGPAEKQALLEAPTLSARADTLIAITELALARTPGSTGRESLQ